MEHTYCVWLGSVLHIGIHASTDNYNKSFTESAHQESLPQAICTKHYAAIKPTHLERREDKKYVILPQMEAAER